MWNDHSAVVFKTMCCHAFANSFQWNAMEVFFFSWLILSFLSCYVWTNLAGKLVGGTRRGSVLLYSYINKRNKGSVCVYHPYRYTPCKICPFRIVVNYFCNHINNWSVGVSIICSEKLPAHIFTAVDDITVYATWLWLECMCWCVFVRENLMEGETYILDLLNAWDR